MTKQILNGLAQHQIIRLPRLKVRTGLSGSSIYNKLDPKSPYYDPSFPKQIPLGAKAKGWVDGEVDAWIEQQIEQSRKAVA